MLCVRMRGRRSIQRHHQITRARAIKRQVAAARGVTTLHIGDLSSFLRLRVRGGPSSRLPRSSLYRHRNVPRRLARRLLSGPAAPFMKGVVLAALHLVRLPVWHRNTAVFLLCTAV